MEIFIWTTHVGAAGLSHSIKKEHKLTSIVDLEIWIKEKIYTEAHNQIPDCYTFYPSLEEVIKCNPQYKVVIDKTWNRVLKSQHEWMSAMETKKAETLSKGIETLKSLKRK